MLILSGHCDIVRTNQCAMNSDRPSLSWLCENIQQHLSRIDAVLAEILDESAGTDAVEIVEPWIDRLFEGRRELQSTLSEIERQIERHPA